MDWLCLLFLSGLLSLSLGIQQDYILIEQSMTWVNAQNYCRTHYTDLATVQSNEDWTSLQEARQGFSGFAWIGLYNDINSWRWSYNEESLVFKNWASGQPNNWKGKEECAAIYYTGFWEDYLCTNYYIFMCYDGSPNATEKFILYKTRKTWTEAQAYCRDLYTDLAIIRSKEDNDEITKLIYSLGIYVWIGLHRDSWKWSDQTNITSSTQLVTQTFNVMSYDCGGAAINTSTFDDWTCTTAYYFCCNTVRRKRQVIRVQVEAAENVDEAKLKGLVLNKLKQTLGDDDITMMWRTQPNGKIFQKKRTAPKRTEALLNTTLNCSSLV